MENYKLNFLFGKRLFIGYIKFFDNEKNFGFVVSNNYGMDSNPRFNSKTQNFYIDKFSIKETLNLSKLVIFQPALYNGKLKAVNVRQFDIRKDRNIALKYFYNQNFICFSTKETIYHRYRSNEVITHENKISILLKSGICRYEIVDELRSNYKEKGQKQLLWAINKLVYAAGGDREYHKTLISQYGNREIEHKSLSDFFNEIDNDTIIKIVSSNHCFQKFVPTEFFVNNLHLLKEEYDIPQSLVSQYMEYKLLRMIENGDIYDNYYTDREREKIIKGEAITGYIEHLLSLCPPEHKEQLSNSIRKQMEEIVDKKVESIEGYSQSEKENFLLLNALFLNEEQKAYINNLIEEDLISAEEATCNLFAKSKYIDAYSLSSFIIKQSDFYYQSSEYIQDRVLSKIEITYFASLKEVLSDLEVSTNYWPVSQHYTKLFEMICQCKLINDYFMAKSQNLFNNSYLELLRKAVYNEYCPSYILKDIQKYVPSNVYNSFLKDLSIALVNKESLSIIYYFKNSICDEYITFSLDYFLDNKSIEQICDFGSAFYTREDKGLSLIDKLFNIVLVNRNAEGDFIIDSQPEGHRSHFLGYIVNLAYRNKLDNREHYKNDISYHDRIILSMSKEYGFDLATSDDIVKEFLKDSSYKYSCPFLQRLRNVKTAIIDLIYQLSYSENVITNDIVDWLRLYHNINDRGYYSDDLKQKDENKLIDAIKHIEDVHTIDFSRFGVDTRKRIIAPSYRNLGICDDFLKFIWHCKIQSCKDGICIEVKNEHIKTINESTINYIVYLLNGVLNNDYYTSTINIDCSEWEPNNLLGYLTMNVLYNTRFLIEDSSVKEFDKLTRIDNPKLASYLSSVINMKAEDGMKAFWRVGDRGDIETTYTNVEISFDIEPEPVIIEILEDVIPDISKEDSPLRYSYHFEESEIASGYGRSYDNNNDIEYKNKKLAALTKSIFLSYLKGLF